MSSYHGLVVRTAVGCAWAGNFLASWQAYGARPFMTEVPLYHEKDGGYFIHRIPALLTTERGTLLPFCEARIGTASDSAITVVVLRRSMDNGRSPFVGICRMQEYVCPPVCCGLIWATDASRMHARHHILCETPPCQPKG